MIRVRPGPPAIVQIVSTRRRALLRGVAILGAAHAVPVKPAAPAPRIALLSPITTPNEQAIRLALKELGYRDGETAVIERRSAEGAFDRLPALAAEIVAWKPDVIVAFVTQASIAAKRATRTIPIVMVGVSDPLAAGLVSDLARPGGNITGTAGQSAVVVGKQLELIREIRPDAKRIGVLWNPSNAVFQEQSVREAKSAAVRLALAVETIEARNEASLQRALAEIGRSRPDAVLVLGEPLFVAHATLIAERLLQHRLPSIGGTRRYAEAGMLATYAPDLLDSSRRAAIYVDRILKGAKPSELPVELASKFDLVVNARTARTLGIAIPPSVMARANEVIE